MRFRDLTRRFLPRRGSDLLWLAAQRLAYPPDFTPAEVALCKAVAPYTLTAPERIVALADSVRHLAHNRIAGSLVECGVWRGGSMMAAALTLKELGETGRELVLCDTFTGMTAPGARDVNVAGRPAEAVAPAGSCSSAEEEVRQNLSSTGYPMERVRMVRGRVEDTLPGAAPDQIALLRLDTDWYESTRHELQHLYPRLARGGVLIIDDYGHWRGAREAVDEYFASLSQRPLLVRVDDTGRCCVKP